MRPLARLALSAILLVAAPIAVSAWNVHRAPDRAYARVSVGNAIQHEPDTNDTPSARVAQYLAVRNSLVDALLPDGEGGTRFYVSLDTNSGLAFTTRAAIGIAADGMTLLEGEHTELHERAHLLHASAARTVDSLLARIGAAAPGTYAATNPHEHFAEMAASAWSLLVEPRGVCAVTGTVEALRDAERSVPGTAGFVEWYLRDPRMMRVDAGDESRAALRTELRAEALRLSEPQRVEWESIWHAVIARRNLDGTFARWRANTTREDLESFHSMLVSSDARIDRVLAVALAPSIWLVRAMHFQAAR